MIKKILLSLAAILALTILILVSDYWYHLQKSLDQNSTTQKSFSVVSGQSTKQIAQNLKNQKIISSDIFFWVYVIQKHLLLQSGVYALSPNLTIKEVAQKIHEGKVEAYLVTIPEGWRITQIDAELAQKKIIKKGELTKIASASEGYLFPDTYRLPLKISAFEIKNLMLKDFEEKTAGMKITKEVIIIASIVEREAKFDEDRPKIAGVYYNRLDKGMKLEADPTVQYAKGSWQEISVFDLKNVNSPYNTYLNDGLPPGPICNPGLKSIEAALYPEKGDFLYFFHKKDSHAVYSKTLEEHQANLEKYL